MAADDGIDPNEFLYRGILYDDFTNPNRLRRCESFQFRSEDVLVASFPRSGTTLTQELVWQVLHHDEVVLGARYPSLDERAPHLELDPAYPGVDGLDSSLLAASGPGPRVVKTHLRHSMLRAALGRMRPRLVVVMRNPKDVAVAQFHFHRALRGPAWRCEWPEFFQRFLTGRTNCGDFFELNLEWWALRDEPGLLLLRYEDLVRQRTAEVRRVAAFLGCELTEAAVAAVAHNTGFEAMRANPAVNFCIGPAGQTFLRQGRIGAWRETFSVAQNEVMERHIAERLGGTGLAFVYE